LGIAASSDLAARVGRAARIAVDVAFTLVISASLLNVAFLVNIVKNAVWRVTASVDGVAFLAAAIFQPSTNAFCWSAFITSILYFDHLFAPLR
jgi:hypothetical protein